MAPPGPLSSDVQAIAEVPLADERTTEAHDFDALFREAGSGVFRTLYAYTAGRRDIAEEAMAEAFARALARSGTIRDPVAWIYRTAFRLANEELRVERRRGPAPTETETAPPELIGLIEALRGLSPNQRAAIVSGTFSTSRSLRWRIGWARRSRPSGSTSTGSNAAA